MQQLKICLIGDSGVGKTCVISRFIHKVFNSAESSTIGANFGIHNFLIEGKKTQVAIWDTASQEKYQSLVSLYYRNTNGCLIVFAMDDPESFYNIKLWYNTLVQTVGSDVVVLIVGNKNDLDQATITEAEIKEMAEELNCMWTTVSAKTGDGITDAFEMVASKLHPFDDDEDENENIEESQKQSGCC